MAKSQLAACSGKRPVCLKFMGLNVKGKPPVVHLPPLGQVLLHPLPSAGAGAGVPGVVVLPAGMAAGRVPNGLGGSPHPSFPSPPPFPPPPGPALPSPSKPSRPTCPFLPLSVTKHSDHMAIAFSFDPLADHQIISFLTHSVNRQSSHCQPHHFISASLAVLKNGILLSADPPHQTPPAPAMVSGGFDWRSNQKIGNRRQGNWAGLCLPIKKPRKNARFSKGVG